MNHTTMDIVEATAPGACITERGTLVAYELRTYAGLSGGTRTDALAACDAGDYRSLARVLASHNVTLLDKPRASEAHQRRVATAAALFSGGGVDAAARALADLRGLSLAEWEACARDAMECEGLPSWIAQPPGFEAIMLPPAPPPALDQRIAAEMAQRFPGRTPVIETEEDVAGGRGEWTASAYVPGDGFARAFYADTVAPTRDAALAALAAGLGVPS